jgi:hypothetical protein
VLADATQLNEVCSVEGASNDGILQVVTASCELKGRYAEEQEKAKTDRLGLWSGEFTLPWEWRAEQRGKGEITGSLPSSECKIKGNISRKGIRIFHLPGQRDYEKTRITESKGERWFCSEAEARAAGWKGSQR